MTNPSGEVLHTVPEAAALLRVSPRTVRTLYRTDRLRITRVGRLVRVPDSALAELLAASTVPASPAERTAP